MADVQNCPVYRFEVTNSAALGAALRAVHGYLLSQQHTVSWEDVIADIAKPISGSIIAPQAPSVAVYDVLIQKYAAFERRILGR
jgi:sugar (pentulose or hexulose) kinase